MGSTVSTGKLIGAFRGQDGQPCYVMYEQTYEKNCYPHTPRWSARAIGGLETMMKGIFRAASACEGGMLQGAGGRYITPEGYIASWLKELANPVAMGNLSLTVKVESGWSAPLAVNELDEIKPTMAALGYETQAAALEAGEAVELTLHGDSQLLSALYSGEKRSAWRILEAYSVPVTGYRDESLGYAPQKAKSFVVEVPRCVRVSGHNENILFQQPDGSWRCKGWAYSIIGDFVTQHWEAELREPGSYRSRIKALRDAIQAGPMMNLEAAKVIFDTSLPVEQYKRDSVDKLLGKVASTRHGTEVHFSAPTDYDTLYSVTALPEENTRWLIPEFKTAPVSQLDLLAG